MRSIMRGARWVAVAAVLAGTLGCGSSVHPVRGRVTFEGKPLPGGGAIAFMPLDDRPGKAAGGEIAEDGTYRLTTFRQDDGSMPGEFRVVITQVTEKEPEAVPDGSKARPRAPWVVAPGDRIPSVYSDPTRTPLRATVEAGRDNEIDFHLTRN
jgi:hypothetical protein